MKTISYLGIPGSYTYIAAQNYFSKNCNFISTQSIQDCTKNVKTGKSDFAVLPLENSLSGTITDSLDFLLKSDLFITGEVILHINHCLLGKKAGKLATVLSHPQAITQCRNLLSKLSVNSQFTPDTATAAKTVSESKNASLGAIASSYCAKLYSLNILKSNIGDNSHNYTRFAIVTLKKNEDGNKITCVFSVAHKPGSLVAALNPYVKLGLNLTKIESRPVVGFPWEYIFFLDFEIQENKDVLPALFKEMKKHVNFLRLLGIYKKGKIYET